MLPIMRSLLLGTSVMAMPSGAYADITDDDIRHAYHDKAALTQLLRWYQYYENPDVGIINQLDILADDFSVTSPSGTANGHGEYEAAVKQFPASWQNAHDLQQINVALNEDGSLNLTAEIVYSNLGMTDSLVAQRMGYSATLAYEEPGRLPKFTDMTITPLGAAAIDEFQATYVQNRLTALVAYWLYLIEHPDRNPDPFKEILAPQTDIKFTDDGDTYRTYEDIAAWVAGPVSSLPATRHAMGPVQYTKLADSRYELVVSFDWQGLRADEQRMTAKTTHNWVVTNDPSERFARIEKIRVDIVEPFTTVK